jgi:hypothetical protein
MNYVNFEKLLNEKVTPYLPLNSVGVVMDNTPYHRQQEDKHPSKTALKKDMLIG